jgi:hypothetical protein
MTAPSAFLDLALLRGAVLTVAIAGLYLVALGVTAVVRPSRAQRFLEAHVSTARVHVLELALRFLVGAALIVVAPQMWGSMFARTAGWILVGTTLVLAVIPWRLHRRFAAWSVPMATRRMPLVALGAVAGGGALLASLLLGPKVG